MIPNNFQIYVVIYLLWFLTYIQRFSMHVVRFICFAKKNKGNFHNFIEFLFLVFFVLRMCVCLYFKAFGTAGVIMIIIIVYIRARDVVKTVFETFLTTLLCHMLKYEPIKHKESPWLVEFQWNRDKKPKIYTMLIYSHLLCIYCYIYLHSTEKSSERNHKNLFNCVVCTASHKILFFLSLLLSYELDLGVKIEKIIHWIIVSPTSFFWLFFLCDKI